MRYLSLFSGIEAATVAWHPLGWECVAVAEIEPFPCALLAHKYPDVPNLGDVSKVTAEDIKALGHIDLIVFGSPCQDLSVAGKRKGLAGARSGLFHIALDIVDWAREHCGARWALWENVPGAFSSQQGRDFAIVVEELSGLVECPVPPKGWGTEGAAVGEKAMVEWATLDAQYFGVAQRRRRVFALADFGNWADRPPILLEPESVRGHTAPLREQGQRIANCLGVSPASSSCPNVGNGQGNVVEVCGTLTARSVTSFGLPEVDGGMYFPVPVKTSSGFETGPTGGRFTDLAPTLDTRCKDGLIRNQLGAGVLATHEVAGTMLSRANSGGFSNSIDHAAGGYMAIYSASTMAFGAQNSSHQGDGVSLELCPTLDKSKTPGVAVASAVRRLTPTECERLQGFPDNYTQVPHRNKPAADGPRYKALGNSMAVPVMHWIGKKIDLAVACQDLI